MKTKYFSKVENKYVFNVSLIFWHVFIALATLAIVVSLFIFLWSIIPASEKTVEKPAYPEKKQYPAPVKVSLNELNLQEVKQKEEVMPTEPDPLPTKQNVTKQQPVEDTKGKAEYEASISSLKTLIPPAKYSWNGSGYWSYPYGERYWTFYKQEKYRQWNSSEAGIEDKLKNSFKFAKATNYPNKKQILDGYISVVKLLPEEKRLNALQSLMSNVADNISQNLQFFQSIVPLVKIMAKEENLTYLEQLARFNKNNPNDGSQFINYMANCIGKFDISQRVTIIERIVNSYYSFFNQNLINQKEATDLFLPMLSQIKGEQQSKALMQYYGLYLDKNRERDNAIAQIENEHQQSIDELDQQYKNSQRNAEYEYQRKKESKSEYRMKSLAGIGGGIILIVLIATVLVFLSIQRSVRKIEEKMSSNP